MSDADPISIKYEQIRPFLSERGRRRWAAAEALSLGYGGIARVHRATGIVPSTIGKGINELRAGSDEDLAPTRSRRPGAGRPKATAADPQWVPALLKLVEPEARGDPMSPLQYTSKTVRNLGEELQKQGHDVSYRTVCRELKKQDYSLNANRKMLEGASHADRDAQFKYINGQIHEHQSQGNPVTSVDTKKKELVGEFKNGGQEWCPKGQATRVNVHDFVEELGRASPYGVYDMVHDTGWVSVGISGDTAEFSVNSLRYWWNEMGKDLHRDATALLVTADCGGSNGYRLRLWKWELQILADELQMPITVCHLPPGTSKWNKIEHKLFSAITRNWRAVPLEDYATIVRLIGSTRTRTGLTVRCRLDERVYETGRRVTDAEMRTINLRPHAFHGEWNYTVAPRLQPCA
jgi:hypothetical protein